MQEKNIKKPKIVEISIFITIVLFVFAITAIYNEKTVKTNTELLSNKKIGWGIKRNDNHEQPDVGSANKNILEQYNGIALGNNEKKYIYLTFDEGYEAGYTSKILEVLKNNQVKATFFITAHYVNTQEELVKQMIEEGHIVGNHTVNHKSMPDLSEEKIKKEILDLSEEVEKEIQPIFKNIEKIEEINSLKVLSAFQECGLSEMHLNSSTGYGIDEIGRNRRDLCKNI